ncbi:MAG: hypothetical protein PHH49_00445 [Candidatus Omnitrophica bacterium]|nr:hypothetical protein [Candidatus Omnitrophota bacterium]MDD5487422.1 hypothetical protein [Candidatus Omnitrophota bacterium]
MKFRIDKKWKKAFKSIYAVSIGMGLWAVDAGYYSSLKVYPGLILVTRLFSVLIFIGYLLVVMGFGSDEDEGTGTSLYAGMSMSGLGKIGFSEKNLIASNKKDGEEFVSFRLPRPEGDKKVITFCLVDGVVQSWDYCEPKRGVYE